MLFTVIFVVFVTVLRVEIFNAQNVHGNCAVGSNCDHCPDNKVKLMKNSMAGYSTEFKVCCSNCNKYFFNFNVLQNSYCTCMNIPEVDTSKLKNASTVFINGHISNTQGVTNLGNCWSGSNCTHCHAKSYVNGIELCCPDCSGYGVSLSYVNNEQTCMCPQPSQNPTGNCWYNEDCNSCQGVSYINGMRVCCPNCSGTFTSLMSIGYSSHCQCN